MDRQSQRILVQNKLNNTGTVTRNWCLDRRITRLSAIIHTLRNKYGMPIVSEPKKSKTDYVYTLIRG